MRLKANQAASVGLWKSSGRQFGWCDRRCPQVREDPAGSGHDPLRSHWYGLLGQVRGAGARAGLGLPGRGALPVVRERIEGMARHRSLDLARVEIHVITAPTLRLDRDRNRMRLLETSKQLRPRLLVLDPLVLSGLSRNWNVAPVGLR